MLLRVLHGFVPHGALWDGTPKRIEDAAALEQGKKDTGEVSIISSTADTFLFAIFFFLS